ncbi:MAG: T9SS type A sorting domain-containing protein [Candidatus Cloacimonetes bacterium]|nr:T9SS type A sorting domain-containing protein [Candidatus Cloacimonadota bacterium]
MKIKLLLLLLLVSFIPLAAVHNFTVNGATSTTIAIGDSMYFEFEFEVEGNAADFAFGVEILGQEIPIFSGNYLLFQDGGMLDETGLDGAFAGGFANFIQLPEGTTLTVTLTDEDISDMVSIQFEQLNTNYSISGNVLQEGSWIDLPVMGGLVYTIYNGGIDVLMELLNNFDLETFLAFIASDHYILSDLTGFLGDYQIFVPEDIPDVVCMTGVYSLLDINGGFIPPAIQEITVNGHETGIDFMYYFPDGDFYGIVTDPEGELIANAGFMLDNPNSSIPYFFVSDSVGAFSISLSDGIYDYTVTAIGYGILTDTVEIDGGDVYREVVLEPIGGIGGQFYGYVYNQNAEPVINAQLMVIPAAGGDPLYEYSMGDGSFSFDLANGIYGYMVSHSLYIGVTGDFEIADANVYEEIVMSPVVGTDGDLTGISEVICYPNPFNPCTTISFQVQQAGEVKLEIFNSRGQRVQTLLNSALEKGFYEYNWQGEDEQQQEAASGLYIYRLSSGSGQISGKLLLLK